MTRDEKIAELRELEAKAITCRMCGTRQPRHAPGNNCCRSCNIELVRQVQGERAAEEMEERCAKQENES